MKKIILLIVSVAILGSCSQVKKVMTANGQTTISSEQQATLEREVNTDSTAMTLLNEVLHDQLDISLLAEQASDEEVITTEREYDTDKPVDPVTGTPPLKRETTQTRRKVDTGRQSQTIGQTTDQQRDVAEQITKQQTDNTVLQSDSQYHKDAEMHVETDEKRGLNAVQQVLCAIGGLVLSGGLAWLAWKLLKRNL